MPFPSNTGSGSVPTSAAPKVSRLGFGCVLLFLLPFFLAGLYIISDAVTSLVHGQPLSKALPVLIFGIVFFSVPMLMLLMLVSGARAAADRATLLAQNPDRPWIYRKEWSDGLIPDKKRSAAWPMLLFAAAFSAVGFPSLIAIRNEVAKQHYISLVGLVFPLIGLFMFIAAAYQMYRNHKFGTSRCRLDHVPIEPGHMFHGFVETHISEVPAVGFNLKLTCLERVATGSGRSRSVTESILWREEQTVRQGAVVPNPEGARVPFSFTPPADAQPTDESNRDDAFVWRLDVTASEPGVDYAAQFELPVFNTADAPHAAIHFAGPQGIDPSSWQPAPDALISRAPLATGGEEIRVFTHAHFNETLGLGTFTLIWFGVIALLLRLHAPFLFRFVFIGAGVLLLSALLDFILGRTKIRADRSGVVVTRSWLGIPRTRTYAVQDIDCAAAAVGATMGGGSGTAYYDVILKLKNGRQYKVAKYLRSRKDAEMLGAKILRDCGVEQPA